MANDGKYYRIERLGVRAAFDAIAAGTKTIEGRKAGGSWKDTPSGARLRFIGPDGDDCVVEVRGVPDLCATVADFAARYAAEAAPWLSQDEVAGFYANLFAVGGVPYSGPMIAIPIARIG